MTYFPRIVLFLTCLATLMQQAVARADGPFDTLLQRLPSNTNAVLAIDVQGIYHSPLARREKWSSKWQDDYLAGVTTLPANTHRLVVGAQFDPTALDNVFKMSLAVVPGNWKISKLADQTGGTLDQIGNKPVVLNRRGGYNFVVAPGILGSMQPANRQAFSRWMSFASRSTRVVLSRYLRQALAQVGDDQQIVMALDTTDMFDVAGVRRRLEKIKGLAGTSQPEQLAGLIAGLKGVTLTIAVKNDIQGQLRLQFSQAVEMSPDLGKGLVLQALDKLGAHVDDLSTWTARVEGDQLILSGKMSRVGARQLMSPLDPSSSVSQAESLNQMASESKDPKVSASARYFHSVTTLLNELKRQKASSMTKAAHWYNTYAKKIDGLPLLNVDPEVVTYGASIAETLRGLGNLAYNAGMGIKYIRNQSTIAEVPVTNYYGGNGVNRFGGAYGYSYYQTDSALVNNFGQVTNLMSQTAMTAAAARDETWKNIDDATAKLRAKLVQKYHVEF